MNDKKVKYTTKALMRLLVEVNNLTETLGLKSPYKWSIIEDESIPTRQKCEHLNGAYRVLFELYEKQKVAKR